MKQEPVESSSVPAPEGKTVYPPPFAAPVAGRVKRKLGDLFGLTNFGINLTTLAPGAASALLHSHARQDEFIYVLEGCPTLIHGGKEYLLKQGDCMGFKAGLGVAHQLVNKSSEPVTFLEVGDRTIGDNVEYPDDDLKATQLEDGTWLMTHKDGTSY